MSRTDSIADFLTLIRNASRAKKESVDVPNSKMNKDILAILKKEGYVSEFKTLDASKQARVYLKYVSSHSAIKNLRRISKPGLRVYASRKDIPNVLRGLGIAVLSTPKGILTNKEARALKVGGEILCYVW